MHLPAHPHVAGQFGEQVRFPAGFGAEINLLDTDGRGPILGLVLFEGFEECKGRDETWGWECKMEDRGRFRRGYWQ